MQPGGLRSVQLQGTRPRGRESMAAPSRERQGVIKSPRRRSFSRSKLVEALSAYLFLLPAAVILFAFQYLPAIDVFRLSLTDRLLLRPFSNFIGFDNYVQLWNDDRFWNSVWNTFYFVAGSVPLQIALALLLEIGRASCRERAESWYCAVL